jgi:hypothetical protein
MSKYIIGIYDDRDTIRNKDLANRYKELTEFFVRHIKVIGKDYIVDKTINEVLNKALTTDAEYCIVMSVGHFINSPKFFTYIDSWVDKIDFFVTGHIIDKNSNNSQSNSDNHYWGLHKQCMIINLKYYEEFGKPEWGDKFLSEDKIELAKAKRSSTDIHDDYTPIFLEPTRDSQVCTPYVDGWNFINKSLENGLKVYNFHPKIRETKRYTYPSKDIETLRNQLSWINNILTGAPTCVFFWNTEPYTDVIKAEGPKIKKLYAVAAAFKPNFMLNKFGFYEDTEVIYYDYSKQALAFKKLLLEEWDGRDYPKFLRYAKSKYQINETFGASTEGKTYEDLWKKELSYWGSEDILYEHWQKYKKLKHTFIYCDILETPEKITNQVDDTEESYIWWSNAFHTVTAHYTKSLDDLKDHYNNNWVEALKNKNPNLICFGTDVINNKLRNINISSCYYEGN